MSSSPQLDHERSLPTLPVAWSWRQLRDLVDPSRGICYGIVQPGGHDPAGVPMVNSGDVLNGRVTQDVSFRVAVELHKKYGRSTLRGGEVLVTLVGANFGQVAIAPSRYAGYNCARPVGIVPVMESNRFVMHALQSPLLRQRMDNVANTTAQPTLNLKDLGQLPIPFPPLSVREAIAELLGAFDDRITLLREANATLEAIAQALFKSWFVDFDPVRAKIEGRAPEGMDEGTAALFPDGFENAGRGLIPAGWHEASIYDAAQIVYGAPFASSKFNTDSSGRPLIRIRDLRDEAPGVYTEEVHPKGYLVKPGDIVVGMDGEFRAYLWGGEEAWLNQRVCVFQPRVGIPAAFVRSTIMPQLAHIEATETATTVIHLGKGDIDRFFALQPTDDVLVAFGALIDPVYARIVANRQACRTLAALRDTLLPRLISGQLRLPEAQSLTEEATA